MAGFAGCFSRCVPSCCRQAQDARHHGRYGSPGGAVPVVCNNRCLGLEVQKTAVSPQLLFINKVVHIPVEVPRFSHGPDCLTDQRDPQLLDTVVDAPVLLVVPVPGHLHPCRGADHEIPQLTSPGDAAGSPAAARAAGTDGYVAAPVPLLVVARRRGGSHHRLLPPEGCAPAEGGGEGR